MMKMISELTDYEHVEAQFLIGSVSKGVNANGGSYYSVELRDASGSITAKKWDATPADEQIFVSGNVISLVGETNKYKDQLQLKIYPECSRGTGGTLLYGIFPSARTADARHRVGRRLGGRYDDRDLPRYQENARLALHGGRGTGRFG